MFRIDKSFVDNININKEFVVITPMKVPEEKKPLSPVEEPAKAEKPESEQDILRRANERARQIIAQSNAAAEDIKKTAWQEGYREGREEAQREMDALIQAQAQDAKRVFEKIEAYKEDLYQDLLDNVLTLSFEIAEKIVNIQLKRDDTVYVDIAKNAIQALNASAKFVLHVSRTEYDRFFKEGGQWLRDEIGCVPFDVVCDPYVEEGGCIVESDEGVVNAGIQEQLNKLRRVLATRTETQLNEVL